MLFLDSSVMCADAMTPTLTATNVNELTDTIIRNAMVDELYMTNDMTLDTSTIITPTDWNFDTVFHANFNNSIAAGDVDFTLSQINGFVIKRNLLGDFNWLALQYFPVRTIDDLHNIPFQDKMAALGKDYQYAFVPVLNGIEGKYSRVGIHTSDNKLVIIDKNEVWSTEITDGFCDTTRTYPIGVLTTLNSKYPTTVRNTLANYDVINVSGMWLPNENGSDCEIIDINDPTLIGYITKWSKEFIDFLTNDNVKILKNIDGRMWLCHLSSDVSDTADSIYNKRKLSFTMTETGDAYKNEDLCEAGLIDYNTEPYW